MAWRSIWRSSRTDLVASWLWCFWLAVATKEDGSWGTLTIYNMIWTWIYIYGLFTKEFPKRTFFFFISEGVFLEKTGPLVSWMTTNDTPVGCRALKGKSPVFPVNCTTSGTYSSNILQAGTPFFKVAIIFHSQYSQYSQCAEAGIFASGFWACGVFGVDLLAVGSEKEASLATLQLGLNFRRWRRCPEKRKGRNPAKKGDFRDVYYCLF